jgi:hypothetical protein
MTVPMPNPFMSSTAQAGFVLDERAFMAALLSNSVVAKTYRAAPAHVGQPSLGVSSLDLAAVPSGAAALSNSNPSPGAPDVTVAGLAIAPIRTASAAVTTNLDSEKNIATLLALAAMPIASADHSSISET